MKTHSFTFVLANRLTDSEVEDLYSVVADGTVSQFGQCARIDIDRDGPSLESAIRSALNQVGKCGLRVLRVEVQPTAIAP